MNHRNKIKIGYFADGEWSHRAFKKIISDENIEIAFICVRFDTKDKTLLGFSQQYEIDYLKHKNINSIEFLKKIKEYNCDLFVSMSFNQIFRQEILNIPPLGIINCHAGKLPFYRGRNILNWALINDEKEFGITVHYVDLGVDTGDIILQRNFPINDNDDYNTLLNVAFDECANILYDSLLLFLKGEVKRIEQESIHPLGMYCGRRQEGDEIINWNQNSREIFNFIRAISSPGPQARTFVEGKEIKINKARFFANTPIYKGIEGQVLVKTKEGYLVKTLDSFVEILEVSDKLKVGSRLRSEK